MSDEQAVGPPQRDVDGLIPLSQFTNLGLPIFTDQRTWEQCVRLDPVGVLRSLGEAIDRALVTERGDQGHIQFRHWLPPEKGHRKGDRVYLKASLYQMTETAQTWIHLQPSSARSQPGVSLVS